jgi:3-hydroxybutyryl-CoA dehydrogenase
MDRFEVIGVVGCGLMGSGIAEVAARSGRRVLVHEPDLGALERGRQRIEHSLGRARSRGKLSDEDHDIALEQLSFSDDIGELASADLVIEAIVEAEAPKLSVFTALDGVVGPDAILASNTSSIPIMKLAMATSRPDHVIGLHFFNPVPVLDLVELVPSLLTSDETVEATTRFAEEVLHKQVIKAKDRAGFVVNALLIPYVLSAIRMLESGFASAEDIDLGMVQGCAHPMGPLALADLIGLDTVQAIAESLYAEFKEPLHAPPPLLSRMVDAGLLGRKAGHGFYPHGGAA